MKYRVTLIYDCTESREVEADSPEAACDAALHEAEATLCHQCSTHLELGDAFKGLVYDQDGNETEVGV